MLIGPVFFALGRGEPLGYHLLLDISREITYVLSICAEG